MSISDVNLVATYAKAKMLWKGISVTLLQFGFVNFVDALLKTPPLLHGTNVHVTQTYLAACLWNVNFVANLSYTKVLLQTINEHVAQAHLATCQIHLQV